MKYLVDVKEMKAIDGYTIESVGIPSLVLMERAALETVKVMLQNVSRTDRILCVCGCGNNGGDGVAVARMLYHMGYDAGIYMLGASKVFLEEKCTKETKKQLQIARNIGVPEYNNIELEYFDVVVDAVFGIGLSRSVEGYFKSVMEQINAWRKMDERRRIFAVDIPSGISADDGSILGCCLEADITVTFGWKKVGLHMYPGADMAGDTHVVDCGFAVRALEEVSPQFLTYDKEDLVKLPKRFKSSNKGSYGTVTVIAGSAGMSGACFFSGKAAYMMGSGLVKIVTVQENRVILQSRLLEAVYNTYDSLTVTEDFMKKTLDKASAIVIGPGMGNQDISGRWVETVIKNAVVPVVIDADGLNVLSRDLRILREKKAPVILTPHLGEMSKLVGKSIAYIKEHQLSVCREFAKEYDCICVMKDARTIVSDGTAKDYINDSGNNGMSTGGAGDVLAGVIGGLAASGIEPIEAARLGVYIHGLSGDAAKASKGERCMLASDILDGLSSVLS